MAEAKNTAINGKTVSFISTTLDKTVEPVIELVSNQNTLITHPSSQQKQTSKTLNSSTTMLLNSNGENNTPKIVHEPLADLSDKSQRLVKIEWPVHDWHLHDTPRNISISGSYWGWAEQKPMEKSANGFSYTLKFPVSDSAYIGPTAQNPFLFKFLVDGVWQCSRDYPISVDSQNIENNYLALE